jgi:hypothetical protein
MSDPLRERARVRWTQHNRAAQQRAAYRRLWSLFFVSLASTLALLMVVKIVAVHVAGPDRAAIERGLQP